MRNKNRRSDPNSELYQAILSLETVEECYRLFVDLCTQTELVSMEQRYEVAKMLDSGMIYNDILAQTSASSATISRVNRSLVNGAGAYATAFQRVKDKK